VGDGQLAAAKGWSSTAIAPPSGVSARTGINRRSWSKGTGARLPRRAVEDVASPAAPARPVTNVAQRDPGTTVLSPMQMKRDSDGYDGAP